MRFAMPPQSAIGKPFGPRDCVRTALGFGTGTVRHSGIGAMAAISRPPPSPSASHRIASGRGASAPHRPGLHSVAHCRAGCEGSLPMGLAFAHSGSEALPGSRSGADSLAEGFAASYGVANGASIGFVAKLIPAESTCHRADSGTATATRSASARTAAR